MKNVLVSGGAGYIGSHIIELLLKKNFKVYILDNLSTGHKILINKDGKIEDTFAAFTNPNSSKIKKKIEDALYR